MFLNLTYVLIKNDQGLFYSIILKRTLVPSKFFNTWSIWTPWVREKHLKVNLIYQTPLKMTKYFNFPCQTEMVWMFKNICKNIKPYKFSNAKNIELLVYFYKKILRTWKMLKFQKPKNIGSLTWILLVLIKKKECSPLIWLRTGKTVYWQPYRDDI